MIVAKYKFNPSTYADLLPEFNKGYTSYTKSDTTNSDGTITRTIESSTLPTFMRFGETTNVSDRSNSLLEVLDMNASNLTNMYCMFKFCTNLTSVSCTWNTSQVIDTAAMFMNCSSLTTLDVSKWNTSNVTNMGSMFHNCNKLTSLDVSNFNTSKVTNMSAMFMNCSSLTTLDVSKWNTSKVTNMSAMFAYCNNLISLDISNFETSKVTAMSAMFSGCSKLISLDVSNFETSKATDMRNMFTGCNNLTSLDLSNFDTSNVTDMGGMFYNCNNLTSLDLSNFDTSKITDMQNMFRGCTSLRKVALKYSNQSTVSKIHENLPDRSSTTKGYILSLVDLTSNKNWEILKFSRNEFYLPQPLRKVGDVKDRFYWDYDKGYYCIEQNVTKVIFDGSDDEGWRVRDLSGNEDNIRHCYWAKNIYVYPIKSIIFGEVLCDKLTWRDGNSWTDGDGVPIEDEFLINSNIFHIFKSSISTVDEFKQWISQNPITLFHPLETPIIIDLPEMNQKFSFDTYLPNTYVDVTNLPLQPYSLLLEDDTVRYKSTIEPNTLYTIQFNCLSKSTTNLTLDLGGTRKTVEPTIGVNHVQITTPSELTSDRLFLIGTGIIINEVIVNKGNMNQYTKYFDGEQGVGELQEDGSYIIRISTDNYTGLWEGDLE